MTLCSNNSLRRTWKYQNWLTFSPETFIYEQDNKPSVYVCKYKSSTGSTLEMSIVRRSKFEIKNKKMFFLYFHREPNMCHNLQSIYVLYINDEMKATMII